MVTAGNRKPGVLTGRLSRCAVLTLLALGSQVGCSREFYREWANQDASEAVFEKSRDPRWRLDAFSIEPPALSRFADPYDQDFPPAPPDDPAAEALSPVPQWPDNRLIVPAEGTGYLTMMERWQQEREEAEARNPGASSPPAPPGAGMAAPPVSPPQPSGTPSPFAPGSLTPVPAAPGAGTPGTAAPAPGGSSPAPVPPASNPPGTVRGESPSARNATPNSGTKPQDSTPILLADARSGKTKTSVPPPRAAESFSQQETSRSSRAKDGSVQRTSRPGAQNPDQARQEQPGQGTQAPRALPDRDVLPRSPVPLDPNPTERDMGDTSLRRPNQMRPAGPGGVYTPEQAAELAGVLVPPWLPVNERAYAGLPSPSRPYKITMQQAFTLALINARVYQLQLENLYSAALQVTLQRFAFEPQFYAGMSPLTSPIGAGFPVLNPANRFTYQTRVAPGGQISTLQLSEIAGYGKLLNSGGQLLMGFANQIVFNFVGKNPIQPTVQSSLPLSFVQPFLRGGGRAVILELLTQAERTLLYQARVFAKFRQEFIVNTLTGGTILNFGSGFNLVGFSTGGNNDPTVGFIPLVADVVEIVLDQRNIAYFESLATLYRQLIEGESSGLSRLQVDQVESRLVTARGALITDLLTYRNQLDQFKQQIGIPPDVLMIPDYSLMQGFLDVYQRIDDWQKKADRKLEDLPQIVEQIPQLEDIVLDGHSLLGIYKGSSSYTEEEALNDTLQAAVRIALEYRLDLMNQRAALYDAWRQLRFRANALKGIFNVQVTNQIFTPPTTNNPFAFFSQAKQFNLVLQAELPLIRVNERNNFRQAIIQYQQARRTLQTNEDFIKNQLRGDIRALQVSYINYEIAKRQLVLNIRLKDQAFEQIVAPPGTGAGTQNVGQQANAATQTTNLIGFQSTLIASEILLANTWAQYQLNRLTVYRDIGTLPYDEWEAFSELFPAQYRGPSLGPGTSISRPASVAAPETTPGVHR